MRRTAGLFAAAPLVLALLAGCGGGDGDATAEKTTAPSAAERANTLLRGAAVSPGQLKGFAQADKPSTSLARPSFAYCTQKWGTDGERLAQLTRSFLNKKAGLAVGETLIQYRAGQAKKAFAEFDAAVDACRSFDVPERDGGGTTRSARITQRPPGARTFSYAGVALEIKQDGRLVYGTQLVVRRGDTIVIEQAVSADPQAAGTAASRLLTLSAAKR